MKSTRILINHNVHTFEINVFHAGGAICLLWLERSALAPYVRFFIYNLDKHLCKSEGGQKLDEDQNSFSASQEHGKYFYLFSAHLNF